MCRLLNCLLLRLHLISIAAAASYSELFSRVSAILSQEFLSTPPCIYWIVYIEAQVSLNLVETLQKCPGWHINEYRRTNLLYVSVLSVLCVKGLVDCVPFAVYANDI